MIKVGINHKILIGNRFHVTLRIVSPTAASSDNTCETLKGQNKVRESKQPHDCNEKTAQTQPWQIKQNVLLKYMQTLKHQNLLQEWQELTKPNASERLLTRKKKSLSDKCNFSQGEASEIAWNNILYDLVCVHFGRCGNQVSAGTMEKLWLTRTKTPSHWPRKIKYNNALQNWNTSTLSRREIKKLSYAWEDHVLNINLCVKFVIPLIFTEMQIKWISLFNKSNRVSIIYRRFIFIFYLPTWQLQKFTSHLLLCVLLSGNSGIPRLEQSRYDIYVQVAWNRAKSRALARPELTYWNGFAYYLSLTEN